MTNKSGTGRRGFLKAVAWGGAAAELAGQTPSGGGPSGAVPAASARSGAPGPIGYPRTFTGRQTQMIAFPLGGVAAGTLSLGGRGQLRDWEIFNRPDKGRSPSYGFPAIWVRAGGGGGAPVARVLEARLQPPYQAGFGLGPGNAPGLRRLASATFRGEYPLATVEFHDAKLPVRVTLEAFTPVFPLDAEESGLPVAILRYRVRNPLPRAAEVAIAFSLENPTGGGSGRDDRTRARRKAERMSSAELDGLLMRSEGLAQEHAMNGTVALAVLSAGGKLSIQRGWPEAKWWASPLMFWDDFSADGELEAEALKIGPVGSVCLKREIAAGGEAQFAFVLAWHFPNRTPEGCGWDAPEGEAGTLIGNHYTQRFANAWEAAAYAARNLKPLEDRMRQFLAAMREATLPAVVKEAAMSNLSTLATQTCFRTADGRFRGFEGTGDKSGCCHGNCTHVWNYESTTSYLFPTLARSMREAAFELSERLNGVLPIRLDLPEGKQTGGITAADGTMGHILKVYLDWQLSGDEAWLRALWPKVKRALEFSWVAGGWDGNRDGVMEGVQHNTYDVEFYGPNPMCGIYYLGALRAAEEMARALGEAVSADQYRRLAERGRAWIDEHLFNGEYYQQKVTGIPKDKIAVALRSTGGAEDSEHPDFQVGDGCLVDQLVGQYVADFCGLPALVDPAKIRKTLESIYKYNYKRTLYDHDCVQRVFALNDESALIICDYSSRPRPKIPFSYFAEVMTGFEYSAAVLMLAHGMVEQGLECLANIRRRYDGERRNPWDEAECGHHYARAMAAWSAVVVLSGFRYEGPRRRVSVLPRYGPAGGSKSFWSAASAWGTFTHTRQAAATRLVLSVRYGRLPLSAVEVESAGHGAASSVVLSGSPIPHQVSRERGRAVASFAEPIEVPEGSELVVTV